jgi:hypothetical protein
MDLSLTSARSVAAFPLSTLEPLVELPALPMVIFITLVCLKGIASPVGNLVSSN